MKIKQLEWNRQSSMGWIVWAKTSIGWYGAWENGNALMACPTRSLDKASLVGKTKEDAKAACQADFERRVRECVEEEDESVRNFDCPQCGEPTLTLNDGACEACRVENQSRLDLHYAAQARWDKLSDAERGEEIRRAIHT